MAIKNAILKAKVEGVVYDIMVKTGGANVYVDDTTTLSAKLAEIISDIAGKAEATHSHAIADVTNLQTELNDRPTTTIVETKINTAISDLIGGAPETYDTLKEIADFIASHDDVVDTLNQAIGAKLDNSVFNTFKGTVNALGALAGKDKVAEADLDDALAAKVNAASEGNHSHTNKTVLDTITAEKVTSWDDASAKAHSHANKATLDGITDTKVTAWDAKSRVLVSATEPADMTDKDLWIQII